MDMRDSGRSVVGRYRLRERLGAGGMGVVWRADDELLHVEVALKQVTIGDWLPEAEREQRVARAMREARNAARLREHPHIVSVHDVVVEDGVPWIVMEYVPSRTLAEVVDEDGPLTVAQVRVVGTALVDALATAHALGIVHRDVKPANVLFAPTGRIALADFGIAVHEDDAGLTASGVIGTLEYIAPERLRGDPATPAADLFALGCTLFQAIEGNSPFRREQAYTSMAAVLGEPPPKPRRAGPLTDVILGLLAKEPERRPDAEEVRRALDADVTDSGTRRVGRELAGPAALAGPVRPVEAEEAGGEAGTVPASVGSPAVEGGGDGGTVPAPVGSTTVASPVDRVASGDVVDPGDALPRRRRRRRVGAVLGAVGGILVVIVVMSLLPNGRGGGGGGSDESTSGPAAVESESASPDPTDTSSQGDAVSPSSDGGAAEPAPASAGVTATDYTVPGLGPVVPAVVVVSLDSRRPAAGPS
ncbi:serine/threonine-protein kinase [Embleya sp. MST-111070]|uniref:serine/threonine-protein kinase n=1 Tax=Embleya sp. MST-111070 TaxID=3398231 RepID=UPI003F734E72